MKLLIISALLVAAASSSPVSHTLEVGSNGVVGTSAGSVISPLVSLIINIGKGLGNLVSVEGLPEAPKPVDPVIVVENPALPSPVQPVPELPGVVHPELPVGVIDPIVPELPVVVHPEIPVGVVDPIVPETPVVVHPEIPVGVVDPIVPETPGVAQPDLPVGVVDPIVPETPIVAPEQPEGVQVVEPIVPEAPIPDTGVQVVEGVNPAPVPAPAIEAESDDSNSVTNNFLINVLLNFFTGKDGTPSFSSGLPDISSLPPGLQQLFAPKPTPRAA